MRGSRLLGVAALVVALGVLGASVAWAVSRDPSPMHRSASGPWMMGYAPAAKSEPVTGIDAARTRAQAFAGRLGLRVDEVLQFERNYYVKLVDGRGRGATEVLVDPSTGQVSLEYGPAMMWNTRYGMMRGRWAARMQGPRGMMGRYGAQMMHRGAGMMGGSSTTATTAGKVSLADAHAIAQRWLDANDPGVRVEDAGDTFPGYYTLETLRDGKIEGMISVNASTGAVWRHWWHGAFVAEG